MIPFSLQVIQGKGAITQILPPSVEGFTIAHNTFTIFVPCRLNTHIKLCFSVFNRKSTKL